MRRIKFTITMLVLFATIALTGCEFTATTDESALDERLTSIELSIQELGDMVDANKAEYDAKVREVARALRDLERSDMRFDRQLSNFKDCIKARVEYLESSNADVNQWLEELAELLSEEGFTIFGYFVADFPDIIAWYEATFL